MIESTLRGRERRNGHGGRNLTSHSTRAQIARLSCARLCCYGVSLRRVNSGVRRLPFIECSEEINMRAYIQIFSILFGIALTVLVDSILSPTLPTILKILLVPAWFLTATRFYLGNILAYSREVDDTGKTIKQYGWENLMHFNVICVEFTLFYYVAKVLANFQPHGFHKFILGFLVLTGIDSLWLFTLALTTNIEVVKKGTLKEVKLSAILFICFFLISILQLDNLAVHVLVSLLLISTTFLSYYMHRNVLFRQSIYWRTAP